MIRAAAFRIVFRPSVHAGLIVAMVAMFSGADRAFGMAAIFAIRPDNHLLRFNSNAPDNILANVTVTGLQVGESLVGIDFRPATGGMYGVGSTGRLYVLNTDSGVATQIGAGTFSPPLLGTSFGVDFNPLADRLRIVSDGDQNIRVNPDTGVVAAADVTLAYAAGDINAGFDPALTGLAYTETISGGSTLTTLYGIESFRNALVRIGGENGVPSANGGVLTTVGPLGVDTGDFVGFDILPNGAAFAVLDIAGVAQLFTINLTTGVATLVGTVGDGSAISGIAIAPPGKLEFSADAYEVNEVAGEAIITVRRVGGSFGSVTVKFLTADGTATAPDDYAETTGMLTFGAGETDKTFTVPIVNDGAAEADETINLTLLDPGGGATLGAITAAVLTVHDDGTTGGPSGCGGGLCGAGMGLMAPLLLIGMRTLRRRATGGRR